MKSVALRLANLLRRAPAWRGRDAADVAYWRRVAARRTHRRRVRTHHQHARRIGKT